MPSRASRTSKSTPALRSAAAASRPEPPAPITATGSSRGAVIAQASPELRAKSSRHAGLHEVLAVGRAPAAPHAESGGRRRTQADAVAWNRPQAVVAGRQRAVVHAAREAEAIRADRVGVLE